MSVGALRPQGSALFGRGYFPIAVPGKQGFLRLVAIDLFHIADIEVMVADLVVFLQAAHDGHTAVGRNPDGAALDRRKLDVEPGGLVGIAARGSAAAQHGIRDGCAGNGKNHLTAFAHPLSAVGGFGHGIGNHAGVIREIGPPGHRGQVGGAVRLPGAYHGHRVGGSKLGRFGQCDFFHVKFLPF